VRVEGRAFLGELGAVVCVNLSCLSLPVSLLPNMYLIYVSASMSCLAALAYSLLPAIEW
jgi:hypothetical protein